MKWCPGIINFKLNVVWKKLIPNFISIVQIPQEHKEYRMCSSKNLSIYVNPDNLKANGANTLTQQVP